MALPRWPIALSGGLFAVTAVQGTAPADNLVRNAQFEQVGGDGVPLEVFLADAPGRMDAVVSAVEAGDPEQMRLAAHAFKSAAGTIEAKRLFDLLKQLEAAGQHQRTEEAKQLCEQVAKEYAAVRDYLVQSRATHG